MVQGLLFTHFTHERKLRLMMVKNLAQGYTTSKSSWSLNLKPAQGYLPDPHHCAIHPPHTHKHFQTNFISVPNKHQTNEKCIRFYQKSKLLANTDFLLYIENFLEVNLWNKKGMLFLVCG